MTPEGPEAMIHLTQSYESLCEEATVITPSDSEEPEVKHVTPHPTPGRLDPWLLNLSKTPKLSALEFSRSPDRENVTMW